ncbi:MAG TPA: primosomal protein N', partial [Candidatus Binatia bacterium]|nr:primosomal protein N' [Candidatus Binatia bacterium]
TVHRAVRRARCHYCNYAVPIPKACVVCSGQYLEQVGFGTERVEAEVRAIFPEARVARVDRDTIRRRGAIAALLARFASGAIDVLVGTQMLAKGHDFPKVTLVGVISADVGLGLADFRAAERTFQLLTQVAGRAGRGDQPGEVIMQSFDPEHPALRAAAAQDFEIFYAREARERRELAYPPFGHLVEIEVSGKGAERVYKGGMRVKQLFARAQGAAALEILGPAPKPLARLVGRERWHLLVRAGSRPAIRAVLDEVLPKLRTERFPGLRLAVDVDPNQLL